MGGGGHLGTLNTRDLVKVGVDLSSLKPHSLLWQSKTFVIILCLGLEFPSFLPIFYVREHS